MKAASRLALREYRAEVVALRMAQVIEEEFTKFLSALDREGRE